MSAVVRVDSGPKGAFQPQVDLTVEPHEGLVRLQPRTPTTSAFVKHMVTMESRALPPSTGKWVLEVCDGFGGVSDTDSDVILELADHMQRVPCEDSDGHRWILKGKPPNQRAWSLRKKQTLYKELRVIFKVGPTSAQHTATTTVLLTWPCLLEPGCIGALSLFMASCV